MTSGAGGQSLDESGFYDLADTQPADAALDLGGVRTVGVLLFPGAEELDFAGPWEVFTAAAHVGDDLRVVTVAESTEPVLCAKGLRVVPDHTLDDAPDLDVLVVPGGRGTEDGVKNRRLLDWIAATHRQTTWTASVCTGSFLLVASGVARGRRITTHWAMIEDLRRLHETGTVLDDVRFVRDEDVVTSAGVSAGIDMSLWLVGQMVDPAFARSVQRYIQYDPAPPYTAEV